MCVSSNWFGNGVGGSSFKREVFEQEEARRGLRVQQLLELNGAEHRARMLKMNSLEMCVGANSDYHGERYLLHSFLRQRAQ